ncbi:hypothetical protein K505DRAFT_406320 [Melanomma pulvis-pyrius CBS 109.77]|uniref:MYND-type domain-containing protein n=1 Tax=Melanomma pulvis-pyrius CBS 109.77 TaxID=1314802 RepID=A0A6A6XJX4_9PLEO|nr:hypothetical protein K505DRAFT_406320 [Melanomma pulvis-pyrius CBS 109.77]
MSESFDWNYPGLSWSRFHSLANLLSLRNGGQAEPSTLADTVLEEDWGPDDNGDGDALSIDTRLAQQISDSGHGRLKRRFLDCLVEFVANKKGGKAVACSAMKEAEDNVVIWIARNEGCYQTHTSCLVDQSETLLWEEMVLYHQNRIEHSYIPSLRASFKAYDAVLRGNNTNTPENNPASNATLSVLRTLLFDHNINGTSTLEKYTKLVIESYNLRRTRNIEELLYSSPNICLIARLRVAFQNFKDIALKLPSFEQVTIILVTRPLAPANPPPRPLNLNQTFGILQLDLGPATTKAVLGQNWTVAKIEREFAKRQKQKPNVHAEVQMLVSLSTNESATSGLFSYFGCSKLSCFMCNCFIQSYGRFTTKGCHGRLFKTWTVPSVDRLLPVQKEGKKKLRAPVEGHIQHERTSVIGGSSVLKNTINSSRRIYPTPEGGEPERDCDICLRPTTRKCNICSKGFFCSDSCEERRSGSHLFTCSKRPLTSADYLWKSLTADLMPQDEDVLEHFGFNNVLSGGEKSYLLGVYGGLYLSGDFSAEDIHEWRVGGILVDKIKEFYYSIPENSRGQYFPWFLKNLRVLERPMIKDEAEQNLIATFYDKARPYLDIEDRNKVAKDLKPEAKGNSYNLLAEMLLRISPNPREIDWYSFGFVTCHGQGEETLMDSKGLKELRSRLPFLESFLSVPPTGPRLSVWDLKQFLEISDPIDFPPIPSVAVDYGFTNCRSFEETCTLMEIYGKVLKTADPLQLHQACVAGDLLQFASAYVRMEERWRPLMRNFYPLEGVVEEELRPEMGSEARSEMRLKVRPEARLEAILEADEDSAGLPSLLSRLWRFIGGFAN